jgi:YD repeat-containing protein
VDEFGKSSTFERANGGQVTGTKDSLGRTTAMSYDKAGRQTGITDAGGAQTKTEYDAAGNKIKMISATGGITTYAYTDDGLLASVTEPRGNVEGADKERFTAHFEYDLAGNATKSIDALDNVTTNKYDALNRLVSSTDANGHTTRYTYNDDDQARTSPRRTPNSTPTTRRRSRPLRVRRGRGSRRSPTPGATGPR